MWPASRWREETQGDRTVTTPSRTVGIFRSGAKPHASALGGFVDSLIQTFENCRTGLADAPDEQAATRFFGEIYEKELPRLAEMVRTIAPELSRQKAEAFYREVDNLIRKVVIPAYTRLAVRFTPRERSDFYLVRENLRALERVGWAAAGLALGAFVVWSPFIPLWSKEWVIPFTIAGFFFPNLRRLLAYNRYERELNRVVSSADAEVQRIHLSYLTSEHGFEEPTRPAEGVDALQDVGSLRGRKDRVH